MILVLAVKLLRNKRLSRFEWTIIVCMFLKYTLYAMNSIVVVAEWITSNYKIWIVFATLFLTLEPIYHWTYASKYIKTCLLTRGIVNRAVLLF